MTNGVDLVKDATPYAVISTGGAMTTLSPTVYLQIAGVVVGLIGAIMAFFRWKEAKRANDINERRLEYEINAISKDSSKAEEEET